MSGDLHPTGISVYGYSVAWVPATAASWTMEQDDEYRNLPAHYPTLDEALDRVAYLKGKRCPRRGSSTASGLAESRT